MKLPKGFFSTADIVAYRGLYEAVKRAVHEALGSENVHKCPLQAQCKIWCHRP